MALTPHLTITPTLTPLAVIPLPNLPGEHVYVGITMASSLYITYQQRMFIASDWSAAVKLYLDLDLPEEALQHMREALIMLGEIVP